MSTALTMPGTQRSRRLRIALVLSVAAVLAVPAAVAAWFAAAGEDAPGLPAAVSRVAFEEETGIRIVRVAVVGAGGLVDVRFQVLDPDKAIAVHDVDSPLVLVDEETGGVVSAAFHGRHSGGTTQTGLNPAATYYLIFANSAGELDRGDTASVVLGDVRLENVPVQ